MWRRFRASSIALLVAFSVSVSVVAASLAPVALASLSPSPSVSITVTSCSEQALQGAVAQAVPGTPLTVQYQETDCTIALSSPLVILPGVNITINGDGLLLDGQRSPSGVFDVQNDQGATSLVLNDAGITDGIVDVSLVPTTPGTGAPSEADSSCWIRVAQLAAGATVQFDGCQATGEPGSSGFSLTCRKQSISDSNKKWVCFGAGQTDTGGQASYAATSILGANGGHIVLSTHYRYATYSWQRATARCGIILRRGVEPSLSVTCQASQVPQG